jgi:hypothetical protein
MAKACAWPGWTNTYANLVRVPERYVSISFVAFAKEGQGHPAMAGLGQPEAAPRGLHQRLEDVRGQCHRRTHR